jgi:hypothetical protein
MNNKKILRKVSGALSIVAMVYFFVLERDNLSWHGATDETSIGYWKMFAEITTERTFVESAGRHYRLPVFTPEILAMEGQEIQLTGYYLPFSQLDSVIILSRFPNSSCFYCGKAGIESVAMVTLVNKAPTIFRTDQRLSVTGKLELNNASVDKLAFLITGAKVEEERY